MKKSVLFTLLFVVTFPWFLAGKEPMKFGKVDKADLDMTVYPLDSSASAVVLCNYGYLDSRNMQFVHQMRIKILKDEGKSRGNFWVPAAEKTTVRGQTINLENGIPVVTKLGKDGIFIEHIMNDYYRARVAFPNVKVGSVIDVEFYYTGLPNYWNFQETIPVRWSELILEENEYFSFRKNFVGYNQVERMDDSRWVARDVPAFKSEPYINNILNYLTRFDIEISSIHVPGIYYKDYATNWPAVAKTLRESDNFGKEITTLNFSQNSLEKEIKASTNVPQERLTKAYEAIKKIKWDKTETIWPSKSGLSYSFNKKIGNSADINLNLLILLRKLDIQADPVVLSTRENGLLSTYTASFDKLNYVIVRASIGDKTYLLDATDENLSLGMLPERTINGSGLVIEHDSENWIDLIPQKKNKIYSVVDLKLLPDGTLKGAVKKSNIDFGAYHARRSYKDFNSQDEYLKDIESENLGLSIEDYKISGLDSLQKPLNEEYSIILKSRTTKTNSQLFLPPVLFDRFNENPFKAQDRVYPVDFVTAFEKTQLLILELPDGYNIEKLPENIKVAMPENNGSLQMQSVVSDNKVQILFKLSINKPVFYQKEYGELKQFFDELVKKEAEMLIIKKV